MNKIFISLSFIVIAISLVCINEAHLIPLLIGFGFVLVGFSMYAGLTEIKDQIRKIHEKNAENDYFKMKSGLNSEKKP